MTENSTIENFIRVQDDVYELQERLAYQEALLLDLNDVIARQDKHLDQLEQRLAALHNKLSSLQNFALSDRGKDDEVPPHY